MPLARVIRCMADSSNVVYIKLVFTSFMLVFVANVAAQNEPIPQPECDSSKTFNVRYSSTSKRLYVEAAVSGDRGGCATLSDIFEAQAGQGPLYAVDPETGSHVDEATGTWFLAESLYVEDGITLNVRGDFVARRVECLFRLLPHSDHINDGRFVG